MSTAGVSDYLLYVAYCSQGIVYPKFRTAVFVANSLLFATILSERSLRKRKEMLIIAGMAGADIIYGLGAATSAIYRIVILALGEQNDLVSAWDCIITPFALLQIGTQLSSTVAVVVSSDRLMAVAWPAKYRKLDTRYSFRVLALIVLFGVTSLAAMITSTYYNTSRKPSIPKLCAISSFSHTYGIYNATLVAGAGVLSVAIYIGVFIAYRRSMNSIAPHTNEQLRLVIAQQRRLTVTLGIITLSTLFFFVIPFSYIAVYSWMGLTPPQTALVGLISRFSTINNVAIYVYRQKEVRSAMWALLTRKKTTTTRMVTTIRSASVH